MMKPHRGSWRLRAWRLGAMKTSTFSAEALLRALGGVEGVPPDYALSPQQVLEGVWANPWALSRASAYMLVAWERLLMSDQAEPGPRLLHDQEARARELFSTRQSAKDFIHNLVTIALGEVPRPVGQPNKLDRAKEKRLFGALRDFASTVRQRYLKGEIQAAELVFPGVAVGQRRASGWVAIWQHGWPRQWAFTMLSILLDVREPALKKHLK